MSFYCCKSQQGQTVPAAARTGVYDNVQNNALHFVANQAALGTAKKFAAALYGEKRFLLQELSFYHLALVQPAGDGAAGLQLAYAGNSDFYTSKIGFAYGRNLGEKLALGLQFNYINQHIHGYGNAAQVTVEGGLIVHVSEAFGAGFQVSHAAGAVLRKHNEKLPAIYTIGISYQPSGPFGITAEVVKTGSFPAALQAGLEYKFAKRLWAKAGITSGTAAFFIAVCFRLKDFSIEFAAK
jgi:hypothetical protein